MRICATLLTILLAQVGVQLYSKQSENLITNFVQSKSPIFPKIYLMNKNKGMKRDFCKRWRLHKTFTIRLLYLQLISSSIVLIIAVLSSSIIRQVIFNNISIKEYRTVCNSLNQKLSDSSLTWLYQLIIQTKIKYIIEILSQTIFLLNKMKMDKYFFILMISVFLTFIKRVTRVCLK